MPFVLESFARDHKINLPSDWKQVLKQGGPSWQNVQELDDILLPQIEPVSKEGIEREKRRTNSAKNLKAIALAMLYYHDDNNEFPPAVVTDQQGTPLYSGLVLLLPHLEQESLFAKFKLEEAWNSPHNLPLSNTPIELFIAPSVRNEPLAETIYQLVGGEGSALDSARPKRTLSEHGPNVGDRLLIIEVTAKSQSWAEPLYWDMGDPANQNPPVGTQAADLHARLLEFNFPFRIKRLTQNSVKELAN